MKKFTKEHRANLSKAMKGKNSGPDSPHFKDEVGNKYQMLTVIKYVGRKKSRGSLWLCSCECGGECVVDGAHLRNGHSKSCGCLHRRKGKENPRWKGGIAIQNGYKYITKPSHPNANKKGQVGEHTYVMSKKIGRPLTKGELVHHKNGNRQDNSINNLQLRTFISHPPGQSVDALVKHAIKVLEKYSPETLCADCHRSHTEKKSVSCHERKANTANEGKRTSATMKSKI